MKNQNLLNALIITLLSTSVALAQGGSNKNLKKEFQTLGDNQEVIERVKNLDNQQRMRVVQNRLMDRNNRLEVAVYGGLISGADSYVQSKNLGGALNYHITPRWSVGVLFEKGYNTLTAEGERRYDSVYTCQQNDKGCTEKAPAVDFPLETKMVSVSFYPIYGKLNLFDSSIAQFDLYTSLAGGKKLLNSGETDVYSASLGAAVWISTFLTARLEGRYENYKDLLLTEKRQQHAVSILASVGLMVW